MRTVKLLGVAALLLGLSSAPSQNPNEAPPKASASDVPLLMQKPTMNRTHIVFGYADDLWIVPRAGGEARRLTTGPGVETDPVFSPDGKSVAFTGQYDGNEDVFTVPADGGEPKRLTYHPGPDQAVGWTPDGKKVLLRSSRDSHARYTRLFTIGLDGGLPEPLPLPMADSGSYSADGKLLAYVPFVNHPRSPGANVAWKHYHGGKQPRIYLADLSDSSITKLPHKDSNDTHPMYLGGRLYFLSDRDGAVTLFEYDAAGKEVRRLFENDGLDIRSASAGPDAIVYEKPGALFVYDLKTNTSKKVPVSIKADLPGIRTRFVSVAPYVQHAGLSPTGTRAVFEARGEIFTVPARKGDVRNLTHTPGVAERDPAWSPDGKSIAYFSDESGEYMLHIKSQDGKGTPKKIQPGDGPSFFYNPSWSPDSKKIAYTDKKLNWWVTDVASGKATKIDANKYFDYPKIQTPAWSPDGRWLAFAKQLDSHLFAIFLHSLVAGQSYQVTDGMSDAASPQFDRSGKYLYFTASTNVGPTRGSFMSALNRPSSRDVYLVVLSSEEKSPLAPESDEEAAPAPAKPAPKGPKVEEKVFPVLAAAPALPAGGTRVDVEDIDQRILSLPVATKNYVGLLAGKAGSVYMVEAPEFQWVGATSRNTPAPRIVLHEFDLKARRSRVVLEGLGGVTVSANGEKMMYSQGGRWFIVPTGGAVTPGAGAISLDGMQARIDPRAEWRQMYREVWRLQRDFLYDPKAHGYDLKAAQRRYEPFLAGVATRGDLSYLFEEMLGGLSLGHVYIQGGDRPGVTGPRNGLLGADFAIENGKYRFTRVYRGENWSADLRAPLTQPGAMVKAGEYLLAIDNQPLDAADSVYRLLEGKGGRAVTLRVAAKPDGTGGREVEVTPTANDQALRHYAWVTDNRARVDKETGGKIAYIYLPNTHGAGHDRFIREFYAQIGKQGVIIDERFNGGGFLADEVIEALNRKVLNYVTMREGADQVHPRGIFGPKVMLVNEFAGSGGDYLPYTFRQAKLGTLVGKRTWGGLVGIGGYPTLIDGGTVTAPHMGIWFPNGKWDVENKGVAPDVEVDFDPKLVRAGGDPQLEKGIEIVLAELKKNPVKHPKRPAFPDYGGAKKESSQR